MRGRATSVVLPGLAVLTLVTVVGIAATGSTPHGSDRSRAPSDTLLDALFTLGLVAAAAGGVLLVYGLMVRRPIPGQLKIVSVINDPARRLPNCRLAIVTSESSALRNVCFSQTERSLRPLARAVCT